MNVRYTISSINASRIAPMLAPVLASVLVSVILAFWLYPAAAQVSIGPLHYRDFDLDDIGIAHPGAITYAPTLDRFFIVQAGRHSTTRIFAITPHEALVGDYSLDESITSPLNVAFEMHTARLLIFDPATQQLLALATTPEGGLDTSAGVVRYQAGGFGVRDAQGMVAAVSSRHLYLLDSAAHEIVQVQADVHGDYGVAAAETERVSRIALNLPGKILLRGLAYDEASGHFFTLDMRGKILYEVTAAGQLVTSYALSEMGLAYFQGFAIAPSADSTDDPAVVDLFVTSSGLLRRASKDAPAPKIAPVEAVSFSPRRLGRAGPTMDLPCCILPAHRSGRIIELYLKSLRVPPAATANLATVNIATVNIAPVNPVLVTVAPMTE